MILRAAAAKQAGKIERLFVVGCLSERYADELRAEIPEVDDYFGARTWDEMCIRDRSTPVRAEPTPSSGSAD